MIVIADDLTGAAEIGGIALRFNLTVEIVKSLLIESNADVQIINTNARSLPKEEALAKINSTYAHIANLKNHSDKFKSAFIYVKTDSVLRGYVAEELSVALQRLYYKNVLLVPINPSLKRKIVDGKYYIDESLLHETGFANDPEFPANSANVNELVAGSKEMSLGVNTITSDEGVLVGNATTDDDLAAWAEYHQEKMLFAGGAAFFKALLQKRYVQFTKEYREHVDLKYPVLYVCGSAFDKSAEWVSKMGTVGYPVCYLSENNSGDIVEDLKQVLESKSRAIFAVSQNITLGPEEIREVMARVVKNVVAETDTLAEIVIEGGATAAAILDELAINSLAPVQEISQGVIRCISHQYSQKMITLKPGSYPWPLELWKF
ncbi:hypothetical protein EIM50_18780 [Pseudoxanthomonas sp. SGD-10]|nr:hypothetical protein EIM50_18780 [Pseudoxanthomonas sp. SGD-10]